MWYDNQVHDANTNEDPFHPERTRRVRSYKNKQHEAISVSIYYIILLHCLSPAVCCGFFTSCKQCIPADIFPYGTISVRIMISWDMAVSYMPHAEWAHQLGLPTYLNISSFGMGKNTYTYILSVHIVKVISRRLMVTMLQIMFPLWYCGLLVCLMTRIAGLWVRSLIIYATRSNPPKAGMPWREWLDYATGPHSVMTRITCAF